MNDFNVLLKVFILTDTAVISELEVNDITLKDSHYQLFKENQKLDLLFKFNKFIPMGY